MNTTIINRLRRARTDGGLVEITTRDKHEYFGYSVERVGKDVVTISCCDAEDEPVKIPTKKIARVELVDD